MAGAKRMIFLIVDRGPAHLAKKTRTFVESLEGELKLFYFPPYSPDRNPDELVWKHLKADTVGRMTVTSKDDFKSKVRSSMRSCKTTQPKSAPSIKNHLLDMPRECRYTYELINKMGVPPALPGWQ